jgi:hypothetical protein
MAMRSSNGMADSSTDSNEANTPSWLRSRQAVLEANWHRSLFHPGSARRIERVSSRACLATRCFGIALLVHQGVELLHELGQLLLDLHPVLPIPIHLLEYLLIAVVHFDAGAIPLDELFHLDDVLIHLIQQLLPRRGIHVGLGHLVAQLTQSRPSTFRVGLALLEDGRVFAAGLIQQHLDKFPLRVVQLRLGR